MMINKTLYALPVLAALSIGTCLASNDLTPEELAQIAALGSVIPANNGMTAEEEALFASLYPVEEVVIPAPRVVEDDEDDVMALYNAAVGGDEQARNNAPVTQTEDLDEETKAMLLAAFGDDAEANNNAPVEPVVAPTAPKAPAAIAKAPKKGLSPGKVVKGRPLPAGPKAAPKAPVGAKAPGTPVKAVAPKTNAQIIHDQDAEYAISLWTDRYREASGTVDMLTRRAGMLKDLIESKNAIEINNWQGSGANARLVVVLNSIREHDAELFALIDGKTLEEIAQLRGTTLTNLDRANAIKRQLDANKPAGMSDNK